MGLSDQILGRSSGTDLTGSLKGTLGPLLPGAQGREAPSFGTEVRAPEFAPLGDLTPNEAASPFAPGPATQITPQGNPFFDAQVQRRELEEAVGGGASTLVSLIKRPIKQMLDVVSLIDAPQQAMWAGMLKLMEGDGLEEALKATPGGFTAPFEEVALTYRDPVKGQHNRRIEAGQLLNSFARNVLKNPNGLEEMNPAARFAMEIGALMFLDPLVLIPGAYYAKVGSRIKTFYHGAKSAEKALHPITHGLDVRSAAQATTDQLIYDEIKNLGGEKGILGETYREVTKRIGRASEDIGDSEKETVRSFISDYLTGRGAQHSAAKELHAMVAAKNMDPAEANRLLREIQAKSLDGGEVEALADQVSLLLGRVRGQGMLEPRWVNIRTKAKGGGHVGKAVFTMHDDAEDAFIIGQLINRFGMAPTDAMQLGVIEGARKAIRRGADEAEGIVGDIKQLAGGPTPDRSARVLGGREFIKEVRKAAGTRTPKNASDAFMAARKRHARHGPYVVDARVEEALSERFMKLKLTGQAAKDMSHFVAGIKGLNVISDITNTLLTPGVMRKMVDSGEWDTKSWHIMTGLLDPQTALLRPIFARLKIAEDAMISESNYLAKMIEEHMVVGGKKIKEGSKLDNLIGQALDGNEKALDALRKWDTKGEAFKAYSVQAAFYDGMLERMAKLNVDGFQDVAAARASVAKRGVTATYFPRLYANEKKAVLNAHRLGAIDDKLRDQLLANAAKRKGDFHLSVAPMEMDFIDANHRAFKHGKRRKTVDAPEKLAPVQDFSSIRAMRAYNHSASRKIHIEGAIEEVNELVRGLDAKVAAGTGERSLSKSQKNYMGGLFRRMLGVEGNQEAALNEMFTAIGNHLPGVTMPDRPATRSSLAITRWFYQGLLGWNVGFFLKNLSQGINTATKTGPLNFMQGVARMADPEWREVAGNRNLMNQFNRLFEEGDLIKSGVKKTFRDVLFAPAHASENINRGIAFNAGMTDFLRQKKLLGNKSLGEISRETPEIWEEAINYAHNIANETQFIYGVLGRSPTAGSPVGRMALQFFSWPVKQVAFLGEMALKGKNAGGDASKTAGMRGMMNYIMAAGVFSKIAEHANVDAGSFTGFGFFPGMASPTTQVVTEMALGLEAAGIEDDPVKAQRHFERMQRQMQNMIPAFLQLQKFTRLATAAGTPDILGGVEGTGEVRGFRDRVVRRTDESSGLGDALDASLNPLFAKYGLPELSGEEAVNLLGLPTATGRDFRNMMNDIEKERKIMNREAREHLDNYIAARQQGRFVDAQRHIDEANAAGLPLTKQMIERELVRKVTGAPEAALDSIRSAQESRVREKIALKYPPRVRRSLGRLQPIPPDPLGGTANEDGLRP